MTYRVVMWIALIGIAAQAAFYGIHVIPTYDKLTDTYAEYVEHLEWVNDGCYELKVQLLQEELDRLSPSLQSEQYTMRLRVK